MQYLELSRSASLLDLAEAVGTRNVDSVLHLNGLDRSPNLGEQLVSAQGQYLVDSTSDVSWQRKATVLNRLAGDSDLFEMAALSGSESWKLISGKDMFPNMVKIPETLPLPQSDSVFGNHVPVPEAVYKSAMRQLADEDGNHIISPSTFNEYSTIRSSQIVDERVRGQGDPFKWFHLPWGQITLASSFGEYREFPVYPETISDGVRANYTTMPDMIYQYEPWQIYQSSGPRSCSYSFHFHRDMWTGDHRDGGANKLIRFCQANCYPEYSGSAVHTSTVTLYVAGKPLITGVMTECSVEWTGPLGLDGWYLECTLNISITEVSDRPLSYSVVKDKNTIG